MNRPRLFLRVGGALSLIKLSILIGLFNNVEVIGMPYNVKIFGLFSSD